MVRKLFQVLQYGETILQKPEEETQGQTTVFTSTSQIMEFVLTSKCVGAGGGVLPNMGYIGMCGPKG